MANWKRIKELRDYLKSRRQTKHHKFYMREYIVITSGKYVGADGDRISVRRLRLNGPACGTASCLAGEAIIKMGNPASTLTLHTTLDSDRGTFVSWVEALPMAQRLLGLTVAESTHMFGGNWANGKRLEYITKAQAIKYLNKAIDAKDVMVSL